MASSVDESISVKRRKSPESYGRANSSSENKRRIRNRLTQQEYRKRQANYIKDLETRLETAFRSESDRNIEVAKENQALRRKLAECHKKLVGIQISMRFLTTLTRNPLDLEDTDDKDMNMADEEPLTKLASACGEKDQQVRSENGISMPGNPSTSDEGSLQKLGLYFPADNEYIRTQYWQVSEISAHSRLVEASMTDIPVQMKDLLTESSAVDQARTESSAVNQVRTRSILSDHLIAIEICLRDRLIKLSTVFPNNTDCLPNIIHTMLFGFLSISWPEMGPWFTYTGAQLYIAKMLAWKLDRSISRFTMIPNCMKPTHIQLTSVYPGIIDWVPFPHIRDRLILYHKNNAKLDQLVYDLTTSIVIEAVASQLVEGYMGKVYVSVWDLIRTMQLRGLTVNSNESVGSRDPSDSSTVGVSLPAPSLESLFCSRDYALQAFKLLNADRDESVWRVNPLFFSHYPELYDPQSQDMAIGNALPFWNQPAFLTPILLDDAIMEKYNDLASQTVDSYYSTSLYEGLSLST
ncbi:hypothetical protein F5884DRAFT_868917 [Xylogone sp. PMI_703]|nr:hypothetical protein F5884DRAFT_868917 [Xylogone sp. PMI_703]